MDVLALRSKDKRCDRVFNLTRTGIKHHMVPPGTLSPYAFMYRRADKMAQWIKAAATTHGSQASIPGTHMVGGGNQVVPHR